MTYNTLNLKWIAWDLDSSLADTTPPNYDLSEAPVIAHNARLLRQQVKSGFKVFIYTSRHWDDYIVIEKWLKKHRIPYKGIWCGKPLVKETWDDRVFNVDCSECRKRGELNGKNT